MVGFLLGCFGSIFDISEWVVGGKTEGESGLLKSSTPSHVILIEILYQ